MVIVKNHQTKKEINLPSAEAAVKYIHLRQWEQLQMSGDVEIVRVSRLDVIKDLLMSVVDFQSILKSKDTGIAYTMNSLIATYHNSKWEFHVSVLDAADLKIAGNLSTEFHVIGGTITLRRKNSSTIFATIPYRYKQPIKLLMKKIYDQYNIR